MTGEASVIAAPSSAPSLVDEGLRLWHRSLTHRQALGLVAMGYVLVRVMLACSVDINDFHADAASYQEPPNFIGGHTRPWFVPLVYWVVDGRAAVILQAAVSGLAFVALAAALFTTIVDRRVGLTLAGVVLLLGLSPRMTVWDAALLSESLAMSLTVILIATLIWIDRVPAGVLTAVFAFWVFARDAHLYLGAFVAVGLVVWALRRRSWVMLVGVVLVMSWGLAAYGNDDFIEAYNVTANIAYYGPDDPAMVEWFHDQGMPPSADLSSPDVMQRFRDMFEERDFYDWASTDGGGAYAEYLATHPGFAFDGVVHLFADGGLSSESLVDHTGWTTTAIPPGVPLWPRHAQLYTAMVAALGVASAVVLMMGRRLQQAWLPGALLLSTVPHAVLAYHASPFEVARHGVVLSLVLMISSMWLLSLVIDAQLLRRSETITTVSPNSIR